MLKKSGCACFVSGHDFSRADKPFIFLTPSGLQPARDPLFRVFCGTVEAAPFDKLRAGSEGAS
jgi:hypothetical protein